jgi:hypothetical protein
MTTALNDQSVLASPRCPLSSSPTGLSLWSVQPLTGRLVRALPARGLTVHTRDTRDDVH